MNAKTVIWVIAAMLLATAMLAVLRDTDEDSQDDLPAALADAPDLHMVNASIVQYATDGTLRYRLKAAQIRHFEQDGLTRLSDAEMLVHDADEPPWQIEADSGEIRTAAAGSTITEEAVYLRDNVLMAQEHADGSFIRVQTSAMDYYPERQYAETTRDVMIDTDVGRTMAGGLQGELHTGFLKLFSGAEARVHTIVLRRQFR